MKQPPVDEQPPDEVEEHRMPLLEHLRELRKRVMIVAAAVFLSACLCMAVSTHMIDAIVAPVKQVLIQTKDPTQMDLMYQWLTSPLAQLPGWSYIISEPVEGALTLRASTEGIYTYLRVGILGGVLLSSPIIAFQVWQFIAPGMYKSERRLVYPLTVASTFLFLLGAAFAYIVILPLAFRFFVTVLDVEPLLSIDDVVRTVTRIIVAFGLSYQLPVATWFVARIGLVNARDMVKGFRYAVVAIFVASALITPPDVLTQILLGIPMVILYGISIIVAWFSSTKVLDEDLIEAT